MRLTVPELALPGIAHGFFTRRGGVSRGVYDSLNCGPGSQDEPGAVAENRRRAMAALDLPATALCTLYQIHSAEAVIVTEPFAAESRPHADGMATDRPGVALGILAADCAPILLADAEAGVIGACHAGWKPALTGVIENTVAAMEQLGARRRRVAAAVGPCIHQPSYEVDTGFRDRFIGQNMDFAAFFAAGRDAGHFQFDLPGFVRHRLKQSGLEPVLVDADTYPDTGRFFSFRRATHRREADYGRQLSAIALCG